MSSVQAMEKAATKLLNLLLYHVAMPFYELRIKIFKTNTASNWQPHKHDPKHRSLLQRAALFAFSIHSLELALKFHF
jgi:hypothetical protein